MSTLVEVTDTQVVLVIETGGLGLLEIENQSLALVTETEIQVIEVAEQGPPGPAGGGGGSGDLQVVAAVAVSGHVAAVLNAAGAAVPADPLNALHGAAVVGITRGAAALGNSVALVSQGSLEHLGWTFTPNLPVYLGASGALVQTAPVGASFLKVLGMAQSATRMTVSLQPAIFIS